MKIKRVDFIPRQCACGNVGQVYTGEVCLSCALRGNTIINGRLVGPSPLADLIPEIFGYVRSNWRTFERAAAIGSVDGGRW